METTKVPAKVFRFPLDTLECDLDLEFHIFMPETGGVCACGAHVWGQPRQTLGG